MIGPHILLFIALCLLYLVICKKVSFVKHGGLLFDRDLEDPENLRPRSEESAFLLEHQINDQYFAKMEVAVPKKGKGLIEKELHALEKLLAQFAMLSEPLDPKTKKQLEILKRSRERYENLSAKLLDVQIALAATNTAVITDQLSPFNEMVTPILFVKQYWNVYQWHAIPTNSLVTDKDSLLDWLKKYPIHPLYRDLIKKPFPYEQQTTRYVWHPLTLEHCSAQEIDETVDEIRMLLTKLQKTFSPVNTKRYAAGSSSLSFFGLGQIFKSRSTLEDDIKPGEPCP